jgi:hypothetical protein
MAFWGIVRLPGPLPLAPAYGPLPLRALDARFSPDGSRVRPLKREGEPELDRNPGARSVLREDLAWGLNHAPQLMTSNVANSSPMRI